jgi:hemerythrin
MTKDDDIVKWRDELSLGNFKIDNDHRKIIKYINTFSEAIEKKNFDLVEDAFKSLAYYTISHFNFEEKLLMKIKGEESEGFINHKSSHDNFRDMIFSANRKFNDSRKANNGELDFTICEDLLEYLKEWIIKHIIEGDKKIFKNVDFKSLELDI